MTDHSVPVGDRPEPSPVRGPALVRRALGTAAPVTEREWHRAVVEVAEREGWAVLDSLDHSLVVAWREYGLIVAHVGLRTPPSYRRQALFSGLRRVPGVDVRTWLARDGLAPVEAALGRSAATLDDPDGGRRGD